MRTDDLREVREFPLRATSQQNTMVSSGMNKIPMQVTPTLTRGLLMVLKRMAMLLVLAFAIGWTLNRIEAAFEKQNQRAGFARGLIQGALMPMALPNLLVGQDIAIYAGNNSGRTYKLGYTMGVNACGLIFFGISFWRLRRLKGRIGFTGINAASSVEKL